MTTHLTNIFASPRLLAAAITSILLLGILAPTGSSGTSDGSLNYSNTPFVRQEPTITTFDAPGAGTGPGQGTLAFSINAPGGIAGYYFDATLRSTASCALNTAPSRRLTPRVRAQAPARARSPSASTRQARSLDTTLT